MAVDSRGRLLVVWRDLREDSTGIFCNAFSERGGSVGVFRLNNVTAEAIDTLTAPAVAVAGIQPGTSSSFVISWVETDTLGNNRLVLTKLDLQTDIFPPVAVVDTQFTQVVRQRSGLQFATPALSGNNDGDIALVWSELEAGTGRLYGLMFNVASAIPPPALPLSSSDPGFGEPAFGPAVSVGDGGSFALVWQDSSGSDFDLRLQRYNSDGQVEQPLYSSPGSGGGDNRAVSFLGRSGRGYQMYWENAIGETLRILSVRYDFAGRPLASPVVVSPGSERQRRPVTAANARGLQLLAWEDYSTGSYRVMAEILDEDGTVLRQPFSVASSSSSHLGSLAAAVSDSGDIYLLWERWSQSSSVPDLIIARLDSLGGPLGSQVTVAGSGSGGGRMGSLAVSPAGNLMVAWRQGSAPGANAHIQARVYSPSLGVRRNGISVSKDTVEYIGSLSGPVVASSDSSGNFLVMWREFFSDRNQLYYSLYDSTGNSVPLPGSLLKAPLGSSSGLSDNNRTFNSPAAAVDSAGGFLVLWSETGSTDGTGLFGTRFDPYGAVLGGQFQVPGVSTAALPVISILDRSRVAVAWQDTLGSQISFLGLQLHFHSVLGQVLLAAENSGGNLMVHVEGASLDSVALRQGGYFRFDNLLGGSYRVWVSADGAELPGTSSRIVLAADDPPAVDIGVAADLRSLPPSLPRAGAVSLAQNVPNPFNPSTTVSFTVAQEAGTVQARLAVYDLRGALVRTLLDGTVEPGTHRLEWDGRDSRGRRAASGVYFLRLSAGGETRVRKMVMIK